jgi:hypothetical protein
MYRIGFIGGGRETERERERRREKEREIMENMRMGCLSKKRQLLDIICYRRDGDDLMKQRFFLDSMPIEKRRGNSTIWHFVSCAVTLFLSVLRKKPYQVALYSLVSG